MKFCPYCGCSLPDDDAVFCTACGKRLPDRENNMKEPGRAKRQKPFFRRAKESGEELSREEDGYDGYYEDVVPADNGEVRQSVDKTMLRNIALLIGGVLTVVGVCLAMMLLL